MKNEIRFTLESKQRPKLAQEIGNILGTAPHYERVPSCAYPGGSRRNSERPDSAVTRAWVSGRYGNNGRSASATG